MQAPDGLVTFVLTDIEGSTGLWRESENASIVMGRCLGVIEDVVTGHGGYRPVEQGEGDSTVSVFARPRQALLAALDVQGRLRAEHLPAVRIGIHTGEASLGPDGRYDGLTVIKAARVRDLAAGGEVLVSRATAAVSEGALPEGAVLERAGEATLAGFDSPEEVLRLRSADVLSPRTELRARRTLPTFPTSFVGRSREIDEVGSLLADVPLVTITGVGGSGKTRLAHATASALSDLHRIAWVDLSATSEEADVVAAFAQAIGVSAGADEQALSAVADELARVPTVVVVDNCEHLLHGVAAVVASIIGRTAASGTRVLATSREPIGIHGETAWRMPSLTLPPPDAHQDEIFDSEAVALFAARARDADPAFRLDETTAPDVARICARLDGIPLAIELAAARTRSFSVADLIARLDDRFALLTSAARGGLERHRTLLASVQWSYDNLDDAERALFRQLSVFASPFVLGAAEFVGASDDMSAIDVLDVLSRLVDKSIVRHSGGRYSLLGTLRAFGLDRAADPGEIEALRDRHLAWCIARSKAWGYPLSANAVTTWEAQRDEYPEFLAALDWALRRGDDHVPALTSVLASMWILENQGHKAVALRRAIDAAFEPGSRLWLTSVAPILDGLVMAGDVSWVDAASSGLDRHPDVDEWVVARVEAGLATRGLFSIDSDAIERYRAAGERSRRAQDSFGAVRALVFEAYTLAWHGELPRVRQIINWIDHQQDLYDNWFGLQIARVALAVADGDFAAARARLQPQLERGSLMPWAFAGWLALESGDTGLARAGVSAADRAPDDPLSAMFGSWIRACDAALRAAHDQVQEHLHVHLSVMRALGFLPFSQVHARVIELRLHTEGREDAQGFHSEAVAAVPRRIRQNAELSIAETLMSLAADDTGAAVRHAGDGVAEACRMQNAVNASTALAVLAVALDRHGGRQDDVEQALLASDAFSLPRGHAWRGPVLDPMVADLRDRIEITVPGPSSSAELLRVAEDVTASGSATPRPVSGWESLTAAEFRVVELIGRGLSNPEVAAALHIGVSTVKTHLVHAYQKLQINSRGELIAFANRYKGR